ncbi:MAG: ABC transporter permease [Reinekea sp.]
MKIPMNIMVLRDQKSIGPLLSLILIILAAAAMSPDFLRLSIVDGHLSGSLLDILHRGAPTALVAIGMAIVIGTKGIDLSVGSVVAISGAVSAYLLTTTNLPFPAILALTIAVGMVCGLWNGILVAIVGIQPIVATLILMVAGRGIAQMISAGQIVTFQSNAMDIFGNGYFLALPVRVWIVAIIIACIILVMRKTALGLFIESVGANQQASRLVGIEAKTLVLLAYVFSGCCAAIAGMITAIYTIGWPPQYNLIVKAAIVLLVLLVQSPRTRLVIKKKINAMRGNHHA